MVYDGFENFLNWKIQGLNPVGCHINKNVNVKVKKLRTTLFYQLTK